METSTSLPSRRRQRVSKPTTFSSGVEAAEEAALVLGAGEALRADVSDAGEELRRAVVGRGGGPAPGLADRKRPSGSTRKMPSIAFSYSER